MKRAQSAIFRSQASKRYIVAGFIALILSATHGQAGQALSEKETAAARKVYTAKCAKCHEFYDPKSYPQPQWDAWMQKMRKKSKLNGEQFGLLSRYLETIRADKQAEKNHAQ